MNREQLQRAINAMLNGEDVGLCHDELSTMLEIVNATSDADIAKAWSEISKE